MQEYGVVYPKRQNQCTLKTKKPYAVALLMQNGALDLGYGGSVRINNTGMQSGNPKSETRSSAEGVGLRSP